MLQFVKIIYMILLSIKIHFDKLAFFVYKIIHISVHFRLLLLLFYIILNLFFCLFKL